MRLCLYLLVLPVLSLGSVAHGHLYEDEFYRMGASYVSLLNDLLNEDYESLPPAQKAFCVKKYNKILEDKIIDIRIPIGYFDWTIGREVVKDGRNYGYSPSIDIGAYSALRNLLTKPCAGQSLFCDFIQEKEYIFTRVVTIRGRSYAARVEAYFSSVTELIDRNTGRAGGDQRQRSDYVARFFKNSLAGADAVFYLGHSRNGGGPDFDPPVLVPGTNKVDYNGYYKKKRPGYFMMMSALSGGNQPAILGLMSCDSRDHFMQSLRSKAPETGVITSTAVITVEEVFTALIGGVDAVLRGQCQKGFYKSLRMTTRNQTYITMDGMFE